jgi:iron complex transport system substrate-binding protein
MMHQLRKAVLIATIVAAPVTAQAEPWSYVDGAGETITLEAVPTRIIATEDAAAALIPLGIRPVGIIANSLPEDSKALQGLDLSGIEMVGVAHNEIDIEKAAVLQPDLVIAEYWPLDHEWGGGVAVTGPGSPPPRPCAGHWAGPARQRCWADRGIRSAGREPRCRPVGSRDSRGQNQVRTGP